MTVASHEACMSGPIRVVFFDAAGTLFRIKGTVADIYLQHAVKHGFNQTADSASQIQAAFARAFHEAPPPVFAVTRPAEIKQCERMWWFDIVHNVFYRVGMFEGFDHFFDEIFAVFEKPDSWMLYPETVGVLEELKSRGYELGIISNFDSRLFTLLRGLGIADFFQTITISSLARAAKPSGRIFKQALEKHAVDPSEAVHIGDSVIDDVKGAQEAGLTGILVSRDSLRAREDPLTIGNLAELVSLLSRVQQ